MVGGYCGLRDNRQSRLAEDEKVQEGGIGGAQGKIGMQTNVDINKLSPGKLGFWYQKKGQGGRKSRRGNAGAKGNVFEGNGKRKLI